MGYHTEFDGTLAIDPALPWVNVRRIQGLAKTRRVARRVDHCFGEEGEFWFDSGDFEDFGQTKSQNIIDYNRPPRTQPHLWLPWTVDDLGSTLFWNEREKPFAYVEWLDYLRKHFLVGHCLRGVIDWVGECQSVDEIDAGRIVGTEDPHDRGFIVERAVVSFQQEPQP